MESDLLLDYELAEAHGRYAVRALLTLRGRAPSGDGRIPLNLSLVLDRSGSMSGDKIHHARSAAALVAGRLYPEDVISVVAFDDHVETVAEPGTGAEQSELTRAIRGIDTRGMTNLSGGWLRGRELVASRQTTGGVNRILLLTDGLANVGVTDHAALVGLARQGAESGISTTTIGFGTGFDEALLRAMADAGGGSAYYIENADQAPAIFDDELQGLLTLSAQNVTVEIRPSGAGAFTRVHHGYPSTSTADSVMLQVGDLYAREPKRVLMEFAVPPGSEATEVAEVVVRADVLTAGGGIERQEVRLTLRTDLDPAGRRDPEIHREALLLDAARSREEARELEARGDLRGAEKRLRDSSDRLRKELPEDADAREESADLQAMAERCAAGPLSDRDRKYNQQRTYDAMRSKRASMASYARMQSGIRFERGDASRPIGPGPMIIAHAVDVGGSWGIGFSHALTARWPAVEEAYRTWTTANGDRAALGGMRVVSVAPDLGVALLAVREAGQGERPRLSHRALDHALRGLAVEARKAGASVHMPRMASAAGGGRWEEIERLVEWHLCGAGVEVRVYDP
jgi:Ca-activated chloride channel homolog